MNPQTHTTTNHILQVSRLAVGYDGRAICTGIDFTLAPGEILAVVGPNGGGKTTLFRTLMRERTPIDGTIKLRGKPLATYTPQALAKEAAIVTTERPHTEHSTCRDMVAMGRYPYTGAFGRLSPADETVVERVMEEAGVMELAASNFHEISDGQRQRVLLAKAFAQETGLLLLDEPTSYLDIRYRLEFLEALTEKVRRDKLAVVMSMHEVDLAVRAADRILCVAGGMAKCVAPEALKDEATLCELFGMEQTLYRRWSDGGAGDRYE